LLLTAELLTPILAGAAGNESNHQSNQTLFKNGQNSKKCFYISFSTTLFNPIEPLTQKRVFLTSLKHAHPHARFYNFFTTFLQLF
jgi:hypothetical protein